MEAIDYPGALRKSWRLLLVLAVVGGVIGYLLPTGHGKSKASEVWCSTATAGAPPSTGGGSGANSGFNAGIPTNQIVFYSQSAQVLANAAQAAGIPGTPSQLTSMITVQGPTKKTGTPGVVQVTGCARTAQKSAEFTNAFVNALGAYIQSKASVRQNSQENQLSQNIAKLEAEISKEQSSGKPAPDLPQLQQQLQDTRNNLTQLQNSPVNTGYQPLMLASPDRATLKGSTASTISNTLKVSHKVRGLIGFVIGLLLACIVVFLREMLDKRIRSASRAEEMFGYPVVAEIPTAPSPSLDAGGGRVVSLVDVSREPASPTAEAYRMLRMSVLFEALAVVPSVENGGTQVFGAAYSPPYSPPPASPYPSAYPTAAGPSPYQGPVQGAFDPPYTPRPDGHAGLPAGTAAPTASGQSNQIVPAGAAMPASRKVILVVSPGMEATRPFVVANLAATFAEAGQRVLVLSTTELHSTRRAGYGRSPGGELRPADLEPYVQPSHLDNISRLSMTHFIGVSGQLVTRAPALLRAARELADVVFVEAPSLLAVHDGEALTPSVDAVLVVAEVMTTTFEQAKRAGELLRRVGAPVLGVVLTNVPLRAGDTRRFVPQPWETEPPPPGLHRDHAVDVPR